MDVPTTAEVMRLGRIHSFAELGEMCGVTRQTARKWATIPEDHCPAIERITGLTAEVMRPDVEWRRDRKGRLVARVVPVE